MSGPGGGSFGRLRRRGALALLAFALLATGCGVDRHAIGEQVSAGPAETSVPSAATTAPVPDLCDAWAAVEPLLDASSAGSRSASDLEFSPAYVAWLRRWLPEVEPAMADLAAALPARLAPLVRSMAANWAALPEAIGADPGSGAAVPDDGAGGNALGIALLVLGRGDYRADPARTDELYATLEGCGASEEAVSQIVTADRYSEQECDTTHLNAGVQLPVPTDELRRNPHLWFACPTPSEDVNDSSAGSPPVCGVEVPQFTTEGAKSAEYGQLPLSFTLTVGRMPGAAEYIDALLASMNGGCLDADSPAAASSQLAIERHRRLDGIGEGGLLLAGTLTLHLYPSSTIRLELVFVMARRGDQAITVSALGKVLPPDEDLTDVIELGAARAGW